MKLTSVVRALEKTEDELVRELKNVRKALAALSGNSRRVRSMNKTARLKISRALKRAWKKRKRLA